MMDKTTRHNIMYLSIMGLAGILAWVGGMMMHSAIQ